jgi:hypothetical protein
MFSKECRSAEQQAANLQSSACKSSMEQFVQATLTGPLQITWTLTEPRNQTGPRPEKESMPFSQSTA